MSAPATLANRDFDRMAYNPEFTEGARNAVTVCLRIEPDQPVTIMCDEETVGIAAALHAEVRRIGAPSTVFVVEDYTTRPMTRMPQPILDHLATSQVGIYTIQSKKGEIGSRKQVMDVVNAGRLMYAHMVNITPQIMVEGMRADFLKIDGIGKQILELAKQTRIITAKAAGGTDLRATFNPDYKWLKTSGIISRDKWGNLPGGEVLTCPARVDGVYVIDGVIGDYLAEKYGDLRHTPITVEIENSRIRHVACLNNPQLMRDFWDYTHTDAMSDRVGEFAIGINTAVHQIIGNMLQDEKIPGMHVAFGDPYGSHTGADWSSTTHIDVVGRDFDVWFDDLQIMRNSQFIV